LKRYFWVIPVVIAWAVYSVACNNFFVFDDFIWLHRARTLEHNWLQMFSPDVLYFDPLIHLMFLADFYIADLDPRWYHAVDITIHAVNALLVYRLTTLLSADEKAGLFASVIFASSFAIADAVLWPSSRVDLVSVMFSLGTLILFTKFLRTNEKMFLWFSCCTFVLALGAKGTPVVIPAIVLWLIRMEEKPKRSFMAAVPFCLLALLYGALVAMALHRTASGPIPGFHLNLRNLYLAFDALFIPERHLEILNPAVIAGLLAILVVTLVLLRFTAESLTRLCRTGVVCLVAALLPVLVLKDFKLATYQDPIHLLSSPSHRIYLASIGLALLAGAVLRSFYSVLLRRYSAKGAGFAITAMLAAIVCFNASEVRERDVLWETEGDAIHLRLVQLLDHRDRIVEDGFVGLSNFPGSRGFLNPMLMVYFNLNSITTETVLHVGSTSDPEKLRRAERSSFFVMGNDLRLYDLSDDVRTLLLLSRQAGLSPSDSSCSREITDIATQTNMKIDEILEKQ